MKKKHITIQEGRGKVQFVALMTFMATAYASLLTSWSPETRFGVTIAAAAVSAVATATVLAFTKTW